MSIPASRAVTPRLDLERSQDPDCSGDSSAFVTAPEWVMAQPVSLVPGMSRALTLWAMYTYSRETFMCLRSSESPGRGRRTEAESGAPCAQPWTLFRGSVAALLGRGPFAPAPAAGRISVVLAERAGFALLPRSLARRLDGLSDAMCSASLL
jgi:hypothetical protein